MKKHKLLRSLIVAFLCISVFSVSAFAYEQVMIVENTDKNKRIHGYDFDAYGNLYALLRNSSETESYIYQNYGSQSEDVPFMTVDGKVTQINVTSDANFSYIYYKKDGKNGVFRREISDSTGIREQYKEFNFDGTDFLFESFVLGENPNEFFIMTRIDENLTGQVGLFNFDSGSLTPERTWVFTLPREWKDGYNPIRDESGYFLTYETSTKKIWIQAYGYYSAGSWRAARNTWFFEADARSGGVMTAYRPVDHVPGIKNPPENVFHIGRYGRMVDQDTTDSGRFDWISSGRLNSLLRVVEQITKWKNQNGETKALKDLSVSSGFVARGATLDAQNNLYVSFYGEESGFFTNSYHNVFLKYQPAVSSEIETPESQVPEETLFSESIILEATPFKGPQSYSAIESRWEIYRRKPDATSIKVALQTEGLELVHAGTQPGSSNTYSVSLEDGEYEWRMAYKWQYTADGETFQGHTGLSELSSFKVQGSSSGGGGGGGCSVYAGPSLPTALLLVFPVLLLLGKKAK